MREDYFGKNLQKTRQVRNCTSTAFRDRIIERLCICVGHANSTEGKRKDIIISDVNNNDDGNDDSFVSSNSRDGIPPHQFSKSDRIVINKNNIGAPL